MECRKRNGNAQAQRAYLPRHRCVSVGMLMPVLTSELLSYAAFGYLQKKTAVRLDFQMPAIRISSLTAALALNSYVLKHKILSASQKGSMKGNFFPFMSEWTPQRPPRKFRLKLFIFLLYAATKQTCCFCRTRPHTHRMTQILNNIVSFMKQ